MCWRPSRQREREREEEGIPEATRSTDGGRVCLYAIFDYFYVSVSVCLSMTVCVCLSVCACVYSCVCVLAWPVLSQSAREAFEVLPKC